jgi:hypothetical protein
MWVDSETQRDRDNEIAAIDEFCQAKGCKFTKLPKFELDFLIHKNGNAIAFGEIRCRNHEYSAFRTQIISFYKISRMIKCAKWLPCYFICKYTDGIYYIEVSQIPLDEIKWGGHNNPRPERPNDLEWLIHFDRKLMKQLK